MGTINLFSTPEKEQVVEYVLNHPEQEFSVRAVARQLKLSPAHISRVLQQLNNTKILVKNRVNLQNSETRALKVLFNIKALQKARCVSEAKKIKELVGVGFYGSWAKGVNTEKSDLDMWIKLSKPVNELKIAKFSSYLSNKLKAEVSILALTPEKIEQLKRDAVFFYSLVYGSVVLWGEAVD